MSCVSKSSWIFLEKKVCQQEIFPNFIFLNFLNFYKNIIYLNFNLPEGMTGSTLFQSENFRVNKYHIVGDRESLYYREDIQCHTLRQVEI